MRKEFLLSDVIKILEIKESLLNQWINRGFIKASKPAYGSGTRNIFSIDDLCRIELFRELIGTGLTRSGASQVALSSHPDKPDDFVSNSIGKALDSLNNENPKPILMAVCMTDESAKDAEVISWSLDKKSVEYVYKTGEPAEGPAVFHMINFTNIAAKIIKKIKKAGF